MQQSVALTVLYSTVSATECTVLYSQCYRMYCTVQSVLQTVEYSSQCYRVYCTVQSVLQTLAALYSVQLSLQRSPKHKILVFPNFAYALNVLSSYSL